MARQPRLDLPGVPQHIVQRGNNRLPCFLDDADRRRYLTLLGEALLDLLKGLKGEETLGGIDAFPMIIGFVAAFISGCLACKWMINIVKKGKLVYFGIYCAIAGAVTIICSII